MQWWQESKDVTDYIYYTNMVGDKETPLVIWKSLNPC